MKRILSFLGFICKSIAVLMVIGFPVLVGLAIWNFDKVVAFAAPGSAAEHCLKDRWEELSKDNPVLAHVKFVSADISGQGYDKELKGTPVAGTFKLVIGGNVKEYPVAGFVSAEKGTVSLDLSASKQQFSEDLANGMTGADLKKFVVAEYSKATGKDERSSFALRYLMEQTSDEDWDRLAPSALKEK